MKFMKLGSKPDALQADGNCIRYVSSELATDVTVNVGDVTFHLHKFPLLSKSNRLQKLVSKANEENSDDISLDDFPGGPKAFEICAKFCYGMTVTLNAYNVVAARCAAEYLEMTEDVDRGNLVLKIEVFLNSSIFRCWKDSIIVLQTSKSLLPWSEDLKIIGRCTDSIASKTSVDPAYITWSYTYNRKLSEPDKIVEDKMTFLEKIESVPKDWWVEDICELDIDLYKRVMVAVKSMGRMDGVVIGEALQTYAFRWIPDSVDTLVYGANASRTKSVVETIVCLLPYDNGIGCSCSFLLKLLRVAILVCANESSKKELTKSISLKLHEACVKDLLIPARSPQTTTYDVHLVQGLLNQYMNDEKGRCGMDVVEDKHGEDEYILARRSLLNVGKLVDGYLGEIAHDPTLGLSSFADLSQSIPDFARPDHDGLYRAIDTYLKEHPELTKAERKKLCGLMDVRKLTAEASMHAAQNECLPLRVVSSKSSKNNAHKGPNEPNFSTPFSLKPKQKNQGSTFTSLKKLRTCATPYQDPSNSLSGSPAMSAKRHHQSAMPVHPIQDLPGAPFGDPAPYFSESELRETAYEILVAACRSSGPKPLTFISQSERGDRDRAAPAPSLHRSLTSTAASKVKRALGLKTSSSKGSKRSGTTGELVRMQMRISEQSDTRIRRALLRIAAGQLGRRMETVVLPLELIQLFRSSDFPSQQEYEVWLRRNLKVLEVGLLLHPYLPLDKSDPAAQSLRQITQRALEKSMDIGKNGESIQTFRTAVLSLACRSPAGSISETCHWADGFPLNLWIYQTLLEACFDLHAESSVIEEVDEVLELIKKTWVMLGINETLHNICFSWVLFQMYVVTGQVENDLLFASSNLLAEVGKDSGCSKDPLCSKILRNTLSLILSWAEKRLLAYHDTFNDGNIESMESVVSLAVLSAKILEDFSHDYNRKKKKEDDVEYTRVDNYIRSSLHAVFIQKLEKLDPSKHPSRKQNKVFPILSILARDITELAFNEKAIFSPKLKRWHPHAAGVAIATLHVCYGNELKKYVKGVNELTPDAIEVLIAADKLEKDLVQIAVADSVDSEDGGKSIIREMQPYEAEAVIATLVKSWIKIRVDRLGEWVDRNIQQEVWNPQANKEGFAPSAIEVLRIIDDTLEAFFLLPIPMHADLLPELMSGLDKSLQQYILKAKSGCGSRSSFIPTLPELTRCSTKSKFNGVFRKKEKSQVAQRRKAHVGTTNGNSSVDIAQMSVRINTMQRIRMEVGVLEKRIVANLSSSKSAAYDIANGVSLKFKLSASATVEGIHQLCECIAYKIVFHDLSHVLWDELYVGQVASARIELYLQELEQYLEIISSTVHDKVRTRVIVELMQASFDGFLLVLLAGGPSRAFSLQDAVLIEEDFKFLTGLFWSNGDGLPTELIEKHSTTIRGVLPLFSADTGHIIQQFSELTMEMYGSTAKSRLPLPPMADQWSPTEPNTLLRVLCNRNDEAAAKFLKKNYNLPTKV